MGKCVLEMQQIQKQCYVLSSQFLPPEQNLSRDDLPLSEIRGWKKPMIPNSEFKELELEQLKSTEVEE
jgi:hypothetical protein